MREAVDVAKLIAGGNLTTQVKTEAAGGEMGLLLHSISEMSNHLRNLIKHIQESIVTVMSTTNQIAGRGQAARKNDSRARQLNGGGRRRGQGDLGDQPRIDADDG